MKKNEKNGWTTEWPTEAYTKWWFYGWAYGIVTSGVGKDIKSLKPELSFIDIRKVSNGVTHILNGSFTSKSEKHIGVFKQIKLPEVPDKIFMDTLIIDILKKYRNKKDE